MSRKPIMFEAGAEETPPPSPADAPPVPEPELPPGQGTAMQRATMLAARRPVRGRGWWAKLVWGAFAGLVSLAIGLAAWDLVEGLLTRNVWLGRVAAVLALVVLLGLIMAALRELAAMARLARVDRLQAQARAALAAADRPTALKLVEGLDRLYAGRADLRWARDEMAARKGEVLDADALLALAERQYLAPLDAAARREVEDAARSVAAATAIVPLALADVAVALFANLRMVRRIAEVYGGRAGVLGSLRLLRAVAAHLVATGAVAVGDDLIGSVAGGGALSKVSRRFGEGVINGALTARVGVAAMEVCRPMPFATQTRPRVTSLVKSALTGMFGRSEPAG